MHDVPRFLRILDELASDRSVTDLVWFGADIEPCPGKLAPFGSNFAAMIGTLADLRDLLGNVQPVRQFDWGIFIAVKTEDEGPQPTEWISSEGEPGQRWKASEIELLAYDDTAIEVTSNRRDLIQRLLACFPTARVIDGPM